MKQTLLSIAISSAIAVPSYAGTVTSKGEDLVIDTNGGFSIETASGDKSFQIGGRLQWDFDDTKSDTTDSRDFDARRARIALKGKVGDWSFKSQFNIAESDGGDGGNAEDLYIRYSGWGKQAELTIGKQREPFGLEDQTSSNSITALERSAVTEVYAPARNAGIQVSGKGSNWTYGVGIFEAEGDGPDDADNTALTGRATFTPIKNENTLIHVGLGYTMRDGDNSSEEVDVLGLEAAGTFGSFHAQAEFFDAELGDSDEDAYYAQFGYIITGETRPYKDGKFRTVKPSSDKGAWEVYIRLEEGFGKYSDIGLTTGEGEQTTIGVNYYANNHIRLGLSYMDGEMDDTNVDGDEIRLRTQFVF